jgi:hypothetical protein
MEAPRIAMRNLAPSLRPRHATPIARQIARHRLLPEPRRQSPDRLGACRPDRLPGANTLGLGRCVRFRPLHRLDVVGRGGSDGAPTRRCANVIASLHTLGTPHLRISCVAARIRPGARIKRCRRGADSPGCGRLHRVCGGISSDASPAVSARGGRSCARLALSPRRPRLALRAQPRHGPDPLVPPLRAAATPDPPGLADHPRPLAAGVPCSLRGAVFCPSEADDVSYR